MKLKVFWTSEAETSFNKNIDYLEDEWNAAVVEQFILKTEHSIATIENHPVLYPIINKKKRIHKCLIVKQISLYYAIFDDRIDLLTFWNNFQSPKKLKL